MNRLDNAIKYAMVSVFITGLLCCIYSVVLTEELYFVSATSIAVSVIMVARMLLMQIVAIIEKGA